MFDFHVCRYREADHLCMLRGINDGGTARGVGLILGPDYTPVASVGCAGASSACDLHEFTLTDAGTALVTQYRLRALDLRAFGHGGGLGWVHESVFQEVRVDDGVVVFEWRSLEHVDPGYSLVPCPPSTSPDAPWDYFHLNSVAKNAHGDYLISARHTSAIYKISGRTGAVLWHLNGEGGQQSLPSSPSFSHAGDVRFAFQHHAQWVKEDAHGATVLLFDNGRGQTRIVRPCSRVLFLRLDYRRRTARVERALLPPHKPPLSAFATGSAQLLPGGNVLVGWGTAGCFTEFAPDGGDEADTTPVLHACFVDGAHGSTPAPTYRVYKANWTSARPLTAPALQAFATAAGTTQFYLSWNGATDVRAWRLYGSASATAAAAVNGSGPLPALLAPAGVFEATFTLPRNYTFARAEALGPDGSVLGRSGVVTTISFVPPADTPVANGGAMAAQSDGPAGWLLALGKMLVVCGIAVLLCTAVLRCRASLRRRVR